MEDIDYDYKEREREQEEVQPVNDYKEQKKVKSKSPTETTDDPLYWKLVLLRNTRNSYLELTDKYLLSDYPITDENRNIMKTYRQYLRNFINENKEIIMNGIEVAIEPIPII